MESQAHIAAAMISQQRGVMAFPCVPDAITTSYGGYGINIYKAIFKDGSALAYDFTNGAVIHCETNSSYDTAEHKAQIYKAALHFKAIGKERAERYRPDFKHDADFVAVFEMAFGPDAI